MVIRCADPVSVFFDTYRNILYQSDISRQDAQSASIPRMFFPVGWKRQPEEGGLGPGRDSRSDATFLWRPSTTSTSQNLKKHPQLHPLPGQCHLPLASLNHIHLTKPQTYPRLLPMLRADVKKISRTDMRLRHSLSLAFHKKIKCIILIDKRIKTSAAVYGKYHTKGGFYHGIQTFRKHDLSSS